MIFAYFFWQCFLYTSSTSFQNFLFRFAITSNVPINIFSHVGQSQRFLVVYRHCGDLRVFPSKLHSEGRYQIQDLSHWCPILPLRHRAPHSTNVTYCCVQCVGISIWTTGRLMCVCVCVYSLVKTVCFHAIGLCILVLFRV